MDGLGALLDRLQGLFGKSFLVVGILPVTLAVLFSLPLVPLVAPEARYVASDVFDLPVTRQAWVYLCAVLAVVFAGFLLNATNGSCRRAVARGIPGLRGWMARTHRADLEQLESERSAIRRELFNYRISVRQHEWRDALAAAEQAGHAGGAAAPSDELTQRIEHMGARCAAAELVPHADAQSAFTLLRDHLQQNDARLVALLREMQADFNDYAHRAHQMLEGVFGRLSAERYSQYPLEATRVQGSMLGNLTVAHQDAIYARYGMNVELFWPAIWKFAAADAAFAPTLEEAKLRLDFAVAMVAVTVVFTVTWVVLLRLADAPPAPFWIVAVAGPLAVFMFYRMSLASAYALNATVRGAIELFRFDVLRQFHCPLPPTSTLEKAQWAELTKLAEQGVGNVTYAHD